MHRRFFRFRLRLVAVIALAIACPAIGVADDHGPCSGDNPLAAIVNRPGAGRPAATSGSACVVPAGATEIEVGVRTQQTFGTGISTLVSTPSAIRVGLPRGIELIVLPPVFSSRTGAAVTFGPATGAQDPGAGFKVRLHDRPAFQDVLSMVYTAAAGTPGPNGFSAGGPTYMFAYARGGSIGAVGLATTQQIVVTAAPGAHFTAYSPSLTIAVPLSPALSLLFSENLTSVSAPSAGWANRALAALQIPLSRGVVADVDYEVNALPAPGIHQRALGVGAAFLLR